MIRNIFSIKLLYGLSAYIIGVVALHKLYVGMMHRYHLRRIILDGWKEGTHEEKR